jgi:hypothetical protein
MKTRPLLVPALAVIAAAIAGCHFSLDLDTDSPPDGEYPLP